jgi:hypothetical protein
MELELLRRALQARKTEWTQIAAIAGVHRKSIERICLHPKTHVPNYGTIRALWAVVFEKEAA